MSSILNGSSIIFSELVPTTLQDLLLQVTKDNIDGAVSIRQSFREDRYSIGYHDLEVNAQKVAGTLRMNGYVPGTKVIILQDDIKAFLITFWGCILSGVVPVLLNYQTIINNIEKLKTVWNDFGRVAILTSGELVSKLVGYFPKDHDVFFKSIDFFFKILAQILCKISSFLESFKSTSDKSKLSLIYLENKPDSNCFCNLRR